MTDQIREQISALLDGELAKDELGLSCGAWSATPSCVTHLAITC